MVKYIAKSSILELFKLEYIGLFEIKLIKIFFVVKLQLIILFRINKCDRIPNAVIYWLRWLRRN
jgi:hypothetical protein